MKFDNFKIGQYIKIEEGNGYSSYFNSIYNSYGLIIDMNIGKTTLTIMCYNFINNKLIYNNIFNTEYWVIDILDLSCIKLSPYSKTIKRYII